MKTNIVKIVVIFTILATSLLTSCVVPQPPRNRGPVCYTGGSIGRPAPRTMAEMRYQEENQIIREGEQETIRENGQAGRMMVHRVNGRIVETRWVPGNTDPDTFEGRPVHHHEHTRVKDTDLDRTVNTLLEKMKTSS